MSFVEEFECYRKCIVDVGVVFIFVVVFVDMFMGMDIDFVLCEEVLSVIVLLYFSEGDKKVLLNFVMFVVFV